MKLDCGFRTDLLVNELVIVERGGAEERGGCAVGGRQKKSSSRYSVHSMCHPDL
ncbi:MAG: hypothetical protein ACK57P_09590, partial [Planctomycetota bacterium]